MTAAAIFSVLGVACAWLSWHSGRLACRVDGHWGHAYRDKWTRLQGVFALLAVLFQIGTFTLWSAYFSNQLPAPNDWRVEMGARL